MCSRALRSELKRHGRGQSTVSSTPDNDAGIFSGIHMPEQPGTKSIIKAGYSFRHAIIKHVRAGSIERRREMVTCGTIEQFSHQRYSASTSPDRTACNPYPMTCFLTGC
jgi:hypothetical protein